MTYPDKARIPGQLPVIATLGEAPTADTEEIHVTVSGMLELANRVSSDTVRQQVIGSLVLSILMNQADPLQALMTMSMHAASGIARVQRQLGQGGSG